MRRGRLGIFALLLGFGTAGEHRSAGRGRSLAALRAGRDVALMRHTDAPAVARRSVGLLQSYPKARARKRGV
jgi:hypothetical protein